eukprot:4510466-Amphidinium_carterae.1
MHWKGNSFADEFAKKGVALHEEVTVDGLSTAIVGARLQELALWVGKQCQVLTKGDISDCDAVPPPRARAADRRAEARVRVPDLSVPRRAAPAASVQVQSGAGPILRGVPSMSICYRKCMRVTTSEHLK